MCGRYYIDDETSREIEKIVAALDKKYSDQEYKKGEIFPTDNAPILVAKGSNIEPDILKWGFPNFSNKGVIINARSETAFEKKTFRESLTSRRCIIPASGFYEWNKNKEKIYFTPKEETIMYMAGIYSVYDNEARFVIITTSANSSVKEVHERMPLLLQKNQLEQWVFNDIQTNTILKQTPYMLKQRADFEQQVLKLS